jgi:hypothetical protein
VNSAVRIGKKNAREPTRRGNAEQREQHSGQPRGSGAHAEHTHRRRLSPEEENWFVEKGAPDETRNDEVAPFDHLLRDRRVEAFVWIGEGSVEQERREIEKRRNGENEMGTGD